MVNTMSPMSSLLAHIEGVRLGCSNEEVCCVHADWVITAMADEKTRTDRTFREFPDPAMGLKSLAFDVEPSVAETLIVSTGHPGPLPASRGLDLVGSKKPIEGCYTIFWSACSSHRLFLPYQWGFSYV